MANAKNADKETGSGIKRFRVYQEDAKTRRTTHWDWDYMSREEMEALAEQINRRSAAEQSGAEPSAFRKRLTVALLAGGILIFLASGFVLMQSIFAHI